VVLALVALALTGDGRHLLNPDKET